MTLIQDSSHGYCPLDVTLHGKNTLTAFCFQMAFHLCILQAVCQPFKWLGHLFARNIRWFKWLCHPFLGNINPFEWLSDQFVKRHQTIEWLGHPFVEDIRPIEWLGHRFVEDIRLFEWLGHPYYGIPLNFLSNDMGDELP